MLIPPLRPPARRLASSAMARCALMRAIALLTLHVVVGAISCPDDSGNSCGIVDDSGKSVECSCPSDQTKNTYIKGESSNGECYTCSNDTATHDSDGVNAPRSYMKGEPTL